MRTRTKRLTQGLAAMAVIACSGEGGSSAASTDVPAANSRREVQETVKAYADALNRADVSSVLELYAREAEVTSIGDGEISRGWENIRGSLDSTLTGLEGRFAVALGSIDVTTLGSTHALAVAPFILTLETAQGPAQLRGAMSVVLQRADSGWQIVHDHTSSVAVN